MKNKEEIALSKKPIKSIENCTRKEFEALPNRDWNEDIGKFDSLIILPLKIKLISLYRYNLLIFLNKYLSWVKRPELYEIKGMHDSGYRCMDFVAVLKGKPLCRLSGCSDVIHINGIGGLGKNWIRKYNKIPESIPVISWSIDCLKKSGLLRLFSNKKLCCGPALSSFEIYEAEFENSN